MTRLELADYIIHEYPRRGLVEFDTRATSVDFDNPEVGATIHMSNGKVLMCNGLFAMQLRQAPERVRDTGLQADG